MAQTVRPLPTPIQDGLTITIQGQTTPDVQKFSVNITSGGGNLGSSDILLHVDTRFSSNNVVRNSLRNGSWEAEETSGGPAPIQKGGPFEITILVANDKFLVSYNGRQYCEFRHRGQKERASHLVVDGQGVHVTNVVIGGPGSGGFTGASTQMGGGYGAPPYGQPQGAPYGQPPYGGAPGGYPGAQPGGFPGGQPGGPPKTEKNLPGGLRPGQIVYINGTVAPSANLFTVNLKTQEQGGDIALHFGVRFSERCAVKNNLQNGQWGAEERTNPSNFPFVPGSPLQMMILADPAECKIAVNGQHFTEFRLRNIGLQAIQWAEVSGDVTGVTINAP